MDSTYLPSFFFFSSRRRHTRLQGDWSSDVCSSDLITGSAFDAETRRGGERRGEETGGMEGGGFAGSARWGAEGAEKEEVRENRLLTRWGWGTAGSAFDAEARRRGERRGEETGGMEGGEFTSSARWGAEGAEKEEVRENRSLTRWGWGITGSAFDAETRRGGEKTRRRNGRDGRWRVRWFRSMGSGGSGEARGARESSPPSVGMGHCGQCI